IEGTGVGLALTKGLVDIMQGKISATSTYGKGTCFTVTIPQKVIEDELVGSEADAVTGEGEDKDFIAPDASILVVDDNEMNRKVVRGLLKPIQAEVDTADGGEEMLGLIRERHYDIIFLDHLMPMMDGIDALTRMKEDKDHLNQDTPVIVMTANAIRGMKAKYLESGFTDYIGKPIDPDLLFDMVRRYLDEDLIKKAEKNTEEGVGGILPPVEGIDWNMALTTATNIRMVRDLVKTFCDTAKRELADLNAYYDKCAMGNDEAALALYRVKVHAMKNSAALVGAPELSEMARALEAAADRKDLIYIRDHHGAYAESYGKIARVLQREVVGSDEEKTMSNGELLNNLVLAEQALNSYDTLTLNDLMLELGSSSFSGEEMEQLVISLQEAVRDFDKDRFFEVAEKIRGLANE
ncbi:MAG: response regulator, partial [Lachnospiraceae bacterium]|nr:response regulator [Lachnospiraceae bacterium]